MMDLPQSRQTEDAAQDWNEAGPRTGYLRGRRAEGQACDGVRVPCQPAGEGAGAHLVHVRLEDKTRRCLCWSQPPAIYTQTRGVRNLQDTHWSPRLRHAGSSFGRRSQWMAILRNENRCRTPTSRRMAIRSSSAPTAPRPGRGEEGNLRATARPAPKRGHRCCGSAPLTRQRHSRRQRAGQCPGQGKCACALSPGCCRQETRPVPTGPPRRTPKLPFDWPEEHCPD